MMGWRMMEALYADGALPADGSRLSIGHNVGAPVTDVLISVRAKDGTVSDIGRFEPEMMATLGWVVALLPDLCKDLEGEVTLKRLIAVAAKDGGVSPEDICTYLMCQGIMRVMAGQG